MGNAHHLSLNMHKHVGFIAIGLVVALYAGLGWYTHSTLSGAMAVVDAAWADVVAVHELRQELAENLIRDLQDSEGASEAAVRTLRTSHENALAHTLEADALGDVARFAVYEAAQIQLGRRLNTLAFGREGSSLARFLTDGTMWDMQLQSNNYRMGIVLTQYNEAVRTYNAALKSSLARFFVRVFGFSARPTLQHH